MKAELIEKLYTTSIDHIIDRYSTNKMTISDLVIIIQDNIAIAKKGRPDYDEIFIGGDYSYGYYDSCEYEITFYGKRLETDEEESKRETALSNKRIANKKAATIAKIKKEKDEKSLYKKLKEKFEK